MIARMFSTHSRSSRSSPIWVSFTEMFESAPAWQMRSNVSRYVSRAAHASAALVTDSPSRSRLARSEEHTSELQSLAYLVCRLLLEKKKKRTYLEAPDV